MTQADGPLLILVLAGIAGLGLILRAAYTRPKTSRQSTVAEQRDDDGFRWDWTTVMVILVLLVVLFALTFELWIPHPMHNDPR